MEFISDVASGGDTGKPSLFEIIAQRKMNELLEPALRHVTSVCAHRYPRYLVRILNYHEEMFAAIMCIIEGYYLKNYGASFTEHFYGMKRERTRKINGVSAMTGGDRAKSLLFLVGLPLAKARLDQYYEKISGGAAARLLGQDFVDDEDAEETVRADADGQAGEHAARRTRREKLAATARRWFKRVYPWISFGYHGLTVAYYIAYMFDKTRYNSPWLHLLRLQVRRLTMQDYRDMDALSRNSNGLLAPPNGSIIRLVRNIVARFLTGGLDMLKVALPMSIFFYKFLEWWYRSDFHKSSQKQPIPPPPNPIKPHPDGVGLPDSPSICPLCKKERTNPAMASTGYVFCYPCIHRWVEEEGCCPVTRVKIVTDDIRKLYTMNA